MPTNLPISPRMSIKPEWIDYNGHLNMAYYMVLFDLALDDLFTPLGLGPNYIKTRNLSFFATDVHITYQSELKLQDEVYVCFRMLDLGAKAMHYGAEMFHADTHILSSTMEGISLHMDMVTRKVAPFPADIYENLEKVLARHKKLAPQPLFGRRVQVIRK